MPSLCRLAGQKVATLKAEHVGHIFTYAGKVPPYLLLGLGPMKGKKVGVKRGVVEILGCWFVAELKSYYSWQKYAEVIGEDD